MSTRPPTVPLHSDHVNYLVWRYLQERGYGNAAVHLSRAWNNDPQKLPFARDVRPHDLVSVIQDGMMFDELSSSVESRNRRYQFTTERPRDAATSAESPSGSYGQMGDTAPNRRRPRAETRTRPTDNPNGPLQAGGHEMDVDRNASLSNHDGPVAEEPQRPLVSTLSTGQSKGIQRPAIATTLASVMLPDTDIMDMCWSRSGSLVVSGGSLWRAWGWSDLANGENHDAQPQSVHLEPSSKPFYVSAAEKDPRTGYIASAFADDDTSSVIVDTGTIGDISSRKTLAADFGGVSLLRWSPTTGLLVVVCHRPRGEELSTWDLDKPDPLSMLAYPQVIEDITWKNNTELVMVGDGFLESSNSLLWNQDLKASNRSIETDALWAFVKYDPLTQACACVAPNQGMIAFVPSNDHEHIIRSTAFHSGQVTAIEWGQAQHHQTLLASTYPNGTDAMDTGTQPQSSIRLLVSSSTDGSIKGWNALSNMECLFTIDMGGPNVPVMTLTVQDEYLAAAGSGKICAWKITWPRQEGDDAAPIQPKPEYMVVWYTPKETGQRSEGGDKIGWPVDESPFHKLSWKTRDDNLSVLSERVLAYSTGNQIHVIDLPP